jgi:hypothetical protein
MASTAFEHACRACGTPLPADDLILVKFRRCFYCGRYNPLRANRKALLTPLALVAAATALTVWWSQTGL